MNDGEPIPITLNYSESLEDVVGKVVFNMEHPRSALLNGLLEQYVIAPSFLVHEDGRREVIGWSLILGSMYKPPESKAA